MNKTRNRFAKIFSMAITDTLFSSSKIPLISIEILTVFLFYNIGIWISPYGSWSEWTNASIIGGAIYALCFTTAGTGLGYYDRHIRFSKIRIVAFNLIANLISAFLTISFMYFTLYEVTGRLTYLYSLGLIFIVTTSIRLILTKIAKHHPFSFTIIGQSEIMSQVIDFCSGDKSAKARYYQYIPYETIFRNDCTSEENFEKLLRTGLSDIVMTKSSLDSPDAIQFAFDSLRGKYQVTDEIQFYIQLFEKIPADYVSRAWILRHGIAKRSVFTVVIKRWFDIFFSSIVLTALCPLMILIAMGIKATDGGPIFFNQSRQGRYFNPFIMFKFRTMHFVEKPGKEIGGFTKKHDSRITKIGQLLRPLHLDELPQILNIFLGQMSFFGPRPEAEIFSNKMRQCVPLYELRYLVRPGLSGLAQINFGYAMDTVEDTKEKLAYDLYYLCNQSLLLDFHIFLRTIFYLIKGAR